MVAGGAGRRFGGPKQFVQLAGRPVAAWSVDAARSVADGVVLVVPSDMAMDMPMVAPGAPSDASPGFGADCVVNGGATRSASVRAGLHAVPAEASVVVVHDAVRPLATVALFEAVVEVVRRGDVDAVVPVLPVGDTLKRVADGTVLETVDREHLVTVQTPQAFAAPALRDAHASGGEATDDAAMLERLGATVRTVPGEPLNLKLTRPDDLAVAETVLRARRP